MADEQFAEPLEPMQPPTPQQSAILARCLAEYNKSKPDGTVVSFEKLQAAVWAKWGRYPTVDTSIATVLQEIPVANIVEQAQRKNP